MQSKLGMKRTNKHSYDHSKANATWGDNHDGLQCSSNHSHSHTSLSYGSLNASLLISPVKGIRSPIKSVLGASARSLATPTVSAQLTQGTSNFDRALSAKGKREILSDNKLRTLLEQLRTDDFVGTIDPKYHSPYLTKHDKPVADTPPKDILEQSTSEFSFFSEDSSLSSNQGSPMKSSEEKFSLEGGSSRIPGPPLFEG